MVSNPSREAGISTCFICNKPMQTFKLIESSMSPHSKIPYAQCIAKSLKNKFVVVVSSNDKVCLPCTGLIEERDNLQVLLDEIDKLLYDILMQKYKLSMNSQVISMPDFTEMLNIEKTSSQNKSRNCTEELDSASEKTATNKAYPFPKNTNKAKKKEKVPHPRITTKQGKVVVKKAQDSETVCDDTHGATNPFSTVLHNTTKKSPQSKNNVLEGTTRHLKNLVITSKIQQKCGSSFVKPAVLTHQSEIVFTCNKCSYKCSSAKELMCHLQVHTTKNQELCKSDECEDFDSRDGIKKIESLKRKLSHNPSEPSNEIILSLNKNFIFYNSETRHETLALDVLQNTAVENICSIAMESNDTSIELASVNYKLTEKMVNKPMTKTNQNQTYNIKTAVKKKGPEVKKQASNIKSSSNANKKSISKGNKKSKSINKSDPLQERKIFQCGLCSIQMKSIKDLQQHFKSHKKTNTIVPLFKNKRKKSNVTFECATCSSRFKSKLKLKAHLQSHEMNDKDVLMPVSGSENYKNKIVFECGVCSLRFEIKEELQDHFTSHTKETIICKHCNVKLLSLAAFVKHQMYHSDPNKPIKCCICKMQVKNLEILKLHMRAKHKMTSQCSVCGEQYTTREKYKLNAHRNAHPELVPYSCTPCKKNFICEDSFLKHYNCHHRDTNCRYCGKEIKSRHLLRSHEKRHETVNSWLCTVCGKVLKSKKSLQFHIVGAHTKAYRYNCNFCSKGYVLKSILEEHINFHHCNNPSLPLTCDICGKQFSRPHTLKIHRNWHDNPFPHSCKLCDKKFKHSSRLFDHNRRQHTGEKPHECMYCQKRFFTKGCMKSHMSSHTGIYAYNCTECNKGWTQKSFFRNHRLKVHGEHIPKRIIEYKMTLPEMKAESEIEDDISG